MKKHASWMQRLPLKRKLAAMMIAVMTVSFLVSAAVAGLYGYRSDRRAMQRHLNILASAIGDNCSAALVFDDGEAAAEILSALEFDHSITGAVLYDENNVVMAQYGNRGAFDTARPGSGLRVDRRIIVDNRTVGYLRIQAENAELLERIATEAVIALTAFVLGVLAALLLFERIQPAVTAPFVTLHETLRKIVRSRDYSIRAARGADDELNDVVMAVNDLLAQVEERIAPASPAAASVPAPAPPANEAVIPR